MHGVILRYDGKGKIWTAVTLLRESMTECSVS
jgi:hypothetical protein